MPDLITHTLFVYPLKYRYQKAVIFILLGSILPDLVGRIPGIIFPDSNPVGWYQTAVHTPFVLLLLTYIISLLFPETQRKKVFMFILAGVASHLFLDLFQKNLNFGYLWFFPFSFSSFQIPLIWPDETIFLIPVFIVFNLIIFVVKNSMSFWNEAKSDLVKPSLTWRSDRIS